MNKLKRPGSAKNDKFTELIYGTENGQLATLKLNTSGIRKGWTLGSDKKGMINCIDSYDLTHDGVADILVRAFSFINRYSNSYITLKLFDNLGWS